MISHGKEIKVFTGNSNPALAQDICQELYMGLGNSAVSQFADGECSVALEGSGEKKASVRAHNELFELTYYVLSRDLAEKRIRHALSLRPRESSYLDSLAWARYLAGDHAGAWKYMEQALRYCEPEAENCELLQHAGAIRLALGDRAGARRYCTQALKLAQTGEKDPKRGPFFRRYSAEIRKLLEQLK